MRAVTFDFLGLYQHGTAFHQYLQLRKRFFVDVLGWNIPHNDDVEMDQYDNPCAHYALVLHGSKVLGGARLLPTTATWGRNSYMLRDALRGEIDIPASVVAEDFATTDVWECTRLVIADGLGSQAERSDCLSLILDASVALVRESGGHDLISLSPVPLVRTLRRLGFPATRIGEPYRETDGRTYAMLRMPVVVPAHCMAAE